MILLLFRQMYADQAFYYTLKIYMKMRILTVSLSSKFFGRLLARIVIISCFPLTF